MKNAKKAISLLLALVLALSLALPAYAEETAYASLRAVSPRSRSTATWCWISTRQTCGRRAMPTATS